MKNSKRFKKNPQVFRAVNFYILISFVSHLCLPAGLPMAYAQTLPDLPQVGAMVQPSPAFLPAVLRGIKVNLAQPLLFDFVLDSGDSRLEGQALKTESDKLIKYFMAALTVPEQDLWVNLSPYEKDRIVPDHFGATLMGRDLLAQDYLLKQLTASLIYPEQDLGKTFWNRIYQKAYERFGTTNVPLNTFNKVWILPNNVAIYEDQGRMYIQHCDLKVMLEEDYLSLQNNQGKEKFGDQPLKKEDVGEVNALSSQMIREIVLPEIEKEVNQGKNFAPLRQIYHSVILATWYKRNLKDTVLGQTYVNQNKVNGVNTADPGQKEKIYQQYLKAFEKGVYDYVREDYDVAAKERVPRKYFSGGSYMGNVRFFRAQGPIPDQFKHPAVEIKAGVDVNVGADAFMLSTEPGPGDPTADSASGSVETRKKAEELLKAYENDSDEFIDKDALRKLLEAEKRNRWGSVDTMLWNTAFVNLDEIYQFLDWQTVRVMSEQYDHERFDSLEDVLKGAARDDLTLARNLIEQMRKAIIQSWRMGYVDPHPMLTKFVVTKGENPQVFALVPADVKRNFFLKIDTDESQGYLNSKQDQFDIDDLQRLVMAAFDLTNKQSGYELTREKTDELIENINGNLGSQLVTILAVPRTSAEKPEINLDFAQFFYKFSVGEFRVCFGSDVSGAAAVAAEVMPFPAREKVIDALSKRLASGREKTYAERIALLKKSVSMVFDVDDPQFTKKSPYGTAVTRYLQNSERTKESTQRINLIKEKGKAIQEAVNIEVIFQGGKIGGKIAILPAGSTLKGYARENSPLEFTILCLNVAKLSKEVWQRLSSEENIQQLKGLFKKEGFSPENVNIVVQQFPDFQNFANMSSAQLAELYPIFLPVVFSEYRNEIYAVRSEIISFLKGRADGERVWKEIKQRLIKELSIDLNEIEDPMVRQWFAQQHHQYFGIEEWWEAGDKNFLLSRFNTSWVSPFAHLELNAMQQSLPVAGQNPTIRLYLDLNSFLAFRSRLMAYQVADYDVAGRRMHVEPLMNTDVFGREVAVKDVDAAVTYGCNSCTGAGWLRATADEKGPRLGVYHIFTRVDPEYTQQQVLENWSRIAGSWREDTKDQLPKEIVLLMRADFIADVRNVLLGKNGNSPFPAETKFLMISRPKGTTASFMATKEGVALELQDENTGETLAKKVLLWRAIHDKLQFAKSPVVEMDVKEIEGSDPFMLVADSAKSFTIAESQNLFGRQTLGLLDEDHDLIFHHQFTLYRDLLKKLIDQRIFVSNVFDPENIVFGKKSARGKSKAWLVKSEGVEAFVGSREELVARYFDLFMDGYEKFRWAELDEKELVKRFLWNAMYGLNDGRFFESDVDAPVAVRLGIEEAIFKLGLTETQVKKMMEVVSRKIKDGVDESGRSLFYALEQGGELRLEDEELGTVVLKATTYQGAAPEMTPYDYSIHSPSNVQPSEKIIVDQNGIIGFKPTEVQLLGGMYLKEAVHEKQLMEEARSHKLKVPLAIGVGEFTGEPMRFQGQRVGFIIELVPPSDFDDKDDLGGRYLGRVSKIWSAADGQPELIHQQLVDDSADFRQAARLLRNLHNQGMIHGHPHDGQFHITKNGAAYLSDFESAKSIQRNGLSREEFAFWVMKDFCQFFFSAFARYAPDFAGYETHVNDFGQGVSPLKELMTAYFEEDFINRDELNKFLDNIPEREVYAFLREWESSKLGGRQVKDIIEEWNGRFAIARFLSAVADKAYDRFMQRQEMMMSMAIFGHEFRNLVTIWISNAIDLAQSKLDMESGESLLNKTDFIRNEISVFWGNKKINTKESDHILFEDKKAQWKEMILGAKKLVEEQQAKVLEGNPKAKETIDNFIDNSDRLIKALEQNSSEVVKEEVDLNVIIDKSIDWVDLGVIEYDDSGVAKNLPKVMADQLKLRQALLNLVKNAVEVIGQDNEGGRISVSAAVTADRFVEIKISDNGPGISKEDLPHIFEPFYTTKGKEGTGVGLYITKKNIRAHGDGADLSVESEEGKGTTFTIKLPIAEGNRDAKKEEVLQGSSSATDRFFLSSPGGIDLNPEYIQWKSRNEKFFNPPTPTKLIENISIDRASPIIFDIRALTNFNQFWGTPSLN